MRVAHLITRMIIGGAQENTLHTVEDQHHLHGDEVSLITGPEEGPEGSLLPRAREGGFPVHIVDSMRRSIGLWNEWRAYRDLCRLLREIKPELVHTHSSKAGILGRAAAASCGIPVVHTIHGAAFHYGQNPLAYHAYVRAERWAARRTSHFISVCDDMTREYLAAGIGSPENYSTVYSGFDVQPFLQPTCPRSEVRSRLGLNEHDVVIGKVARLFHLKGHEFILAIAPQVIAANPRVKFLFVGDGLLRTQIEQQIANLGLTEHFRFTGLVPPTQIPELMGAMDIVVHASQWEGLARVLPQGLIAGKPVVAYDVGGAREVVIPGETGFLLPRNDTADLAAALITLADDPALRSRFGSTGRERFADQFRHEFMTQRIREVYQRVLTAPR
ncbi:MAG: glycosyltransferase family 4 protein [Planctomycetaceae bacterium]|nr:glycosyltransferase family 4 protein [Planctomycetaceae bacterium]